MIEGTEVKISLQKSKLVIYPKLQDSNRKKIIGILGGMGPEATADLYTKIIKFCQKKYGVEYDSDYPQIIVNSIPAPQMIEGLDKTAKKELLNMLIEGVRKLEQSGVDFIVMACNTIHYFLPELRKAVRIPILSIIEETVKKVDEKKIKKLGLLATTTTVKLRIYEKELDKCGIKSILPNENSQGKITKIIRNIIAGKKSRVDRNTLRVIVKDLKERGTKGIIMGCTDLPIIMRKNNFDTAIFDSNEILAEAAVEMVYSDKNE